jgi:hypothetical protein
MRYGNQRMPEQCASRAPVRAVVGANYQPGELIGLITENNASEEQLRQLVYFTMTLFSEPDEPDPDKPAS